MSDYSKLPPTPSEASAVAVLTHVIDSLGFRFYWATDSLGDSDLSFRPIEGAMTLGRQMAHVRRLVQWTNVAMQSRSERNKEIEESYVAMREGTFAALDELKATIRQLGGEGLVKVQAFGFPFWNLINGPIADSLTHTGQINTYRRMLGKPCREINYFAGQVS